MILHIGASHQTMPLDLREKLHLNADHQRLFLVHLKANTPALEEVVVLSTCNRLEVYCSIDAENAQNSLITTLSNFYAIDEGVIAHHFYVKTDREAIQHLMTVASGLDSLVLGEPQILGQVAKALETAQSINSSGPVLNRLFTDAIHTGKRARSETDISRHSMSISHIATRQIVTAGSLSDQPSVLVMGAGEIAKSAVLALVQQGITDVRIVNRTAQRAQDIASQVGVTAYSWEQRWSQLSEVDAVIMATSASEPILKWRDLHFLIEIHDERPLTIIDISVPRAVEVEGRELSTLTYIDLDDLREVVDENLVQRLACSPQVGGIITQEVEKFMAWLASRQIVPVIKGLRQKVHHVVQDELDDVLTRLDHLDDQDKATLQRFAHRIINKVLHDPTTHLRLNAAKSNVIDYTQVVSELFALKAVD